MLQQAGSLTIQPVPDAGKTTARHTDTGTIELDQLTATL